MAETKYEVHVREKFYLFLQAAISVLIYATYFTLIASEVGLIGACIFFTFFALCALLLSWLEFMFLGGFIKGNAVKASPHQFKEIFDIVNEQSKALGLKKVPKVYVLYVGGWINAFVAKFLRKYYVVLFAPVVEEAYKDGKDTLRFIVGHELGHIKRNHLGFWVHFFTFPARLIPFLSNAYSRAREYTCDRIGYALAPNGAFKGMGLLAVGPLLYRKLDMKAWLSDGEEERGFATGLTELFSTHPHLINRMRALDSLQRDKDK